MLGEGNSLATASTRRHRNNQFRPHRQIVRGQAVRSVMETGVAWYWCAIDDAPPGFHLVIAPQCAHVRWNDRDGSLVFVRRSGWQFEGVRFAIRCSQAKQAGIQLLQVVDRGIDAVRYQSQVNRVSNYHLVHLGAGLTLRFPARTATVLDHDGDGQDDGNVIARLLRQHPAPVSSQ